MSTTLGPAELRSILAFTVNLATYRGHTHTGRISGDPGFLQRQREKELGRSSDAQYDVAENLVMGEIKKAYPTFKFIREESASAGSLPELPTFCVDPIDVPKIPLPGVVYNPFIEYLYTRVEGQGSYLTRGTGQPH